MIEFISKKGMVYYSFVFITLSCELCFIIFIVLFQLILLFYNYKDISLLYQFK